MNNDSTLYEALQKSYVRHQKIKPGKIVRVNLQANAGALGSGWGNTIEDFMTNESLHQVKKVEGAKGILLSDGRHYPFYALEVIDSGKAVKLTERHVAVQDAGSSKIWINGKPISVVDVNTILKEVKNESKKD